MKVINTKVCSKMKSLESDFGWRRIMIHRFVDLARLYFWCLQHLGKVVLAYRHLWFVVECWDQCGVSGRWGRTGPGCTRGVSASLTDVYVSHCLLYDAVCPVVDW